jgi:filamentous hemagglutinin family protein
MKIFLGIAGLSLIANILLVTAKAQAQVIAAPNDANTSVNQTGDRFNITGGSQAGANLFHSFQKFGLDPAQTANFISNPNIQNILGRVVGGDASVINGLIQVTGSNANLYLLNPAGIIFGANARLDVPAAFTATTANGIGFGNRWLNAVGTNNYSLLTSNPGDFAFSMSQPGAIFNAGNLGVNAGQTLTLLGGTVINTGTITAEGGKITIAAVDGEKLVRVSQTGSLLSLALPVETANQINSMPFTPASLPQLLTGSNITNATGVSVENGVVKLTGSGLEIPQEVGTAVVSNQVDVSGTTGGAVNILGNKVGVVSANINANGNNGGGTVLIGGDYQGKGSVPNAQRTYVSADSVVNVDAKHTGNGGRVIVWADEATSFYGNINARGGANSGNGGFVEVSGKENLTFDGLVNVGATNGKSGTLLLDPATVRILDTLPNNNGSLADGQILVNEGGGGSNFIITPNAVINALNNGSVAIAAGNSISVEENVDASSVPQTSNLSFSAPQIDLFRSVTLNGGDITLNAPTRIQVESPINSDGGNISFTSPLINLRQPDLGTFTALVNSNGGNINFNGAVTINKDPLATQSEVFINSSGNGNGSIKFSSTINSFNATPRSLLLRTSSNGNVEVGGAIGNSNPLNTLRTDSVNNVSLKDFIGNGLDINASGNVDIISTSDLTLNRDIRAFGKINLQAQNLTIEGISTTISAADNLDIKTQGNLVLDGITIEAGSLSVKSDGNFTATGSQVNSRGDTQLESQNNFVSENSKVRSLGDLTLRSLSNNITLRGTDISSTGNIQLQTPQQVQVSETPGATGNPALIVGKGQVNITGTQGIDIQALTRPESLLRSGGDFNLTSNNAITGNARIATGGNFSAGPGSFNQSELSLNGIISSNGNVSFGDYTGSSLKVEARGNIRAGNITITEPGKFSQNSDPDINTLNTGPAVILRAGVTNLQYTPDNPANRSVEGIAFTFPQGQAPETLTLPGSIEVQNISTAATPGFVATPNSSFGSYFPAYSVILAATGEIKAGDINTIDGSVKLITETGNIIVNTINTRGDFNKGGGNVEIDAGGIFRAQGTFPALFTFVSGSNSPSPEISNLDLNNVPASILTSVFGTAGVNDIAVGGTVEIKHQGESFIERYTPGNIADNVSGTTGFILRSSGDNAGLYGSLTDRTLTGSSSITITGNPRIDGGGGGGNDGGGNDGGGNGGGVNVAEAQNVQRQLNQQTQRSVCEPADSTTVAVNPSGNTRGGQRSASQPSQNNPCPANNSSEKILQQSPQQPTQPILNKPQSLLQPR